MGKVFIYSLACPETGRVRYIGKANSMADRLQTHFRDSQRARPTPVRCWVRSLLDRNLVPVMALVAEVTTETWEAEERRFIAEYRVSSPGLLNLADGGMGASQTKAQRVHGGQAAARSRVSSPEAAELYNMRATIGNGLKWLRKNSPDGYERIMQEIRPLAEQYPVHFGKWAGL